MTLHLATSSLPPPSGSSPIRGKSVPKISSLAYMMEDPRNIGSCTHVLFMAKNIERIGDHATNIAEKVYYLVHGTPLTQIRPKGDKSSLEVVAPDRASDPVGAG